MKIPANLLADLQAKYPTLTPIQQKAMKLIEEGEDVIGVAKTGSGKTLAYSLPILLKIVK